MTSSLNIAIYLFKNVASLIREVRNRRRIWLNREENSFIFELQPSASISTPPSRLEGIISEEEDEPPALGSTLSAGEEEREREKREEKEKKEKNEGADPRYDLPLDRRFIVCSNSILSKCVTTNWVRTSNLRGWRRILVTSGYGAQSISTMAGKMARRSTMATFVLFKALIFPAYSGLAFVPNPADIAIDGD